MSLNIFQKVLQIEYAITIAVFIFSSSPAQCSKKTFYIQSDDVPPLHSMLCLLTSNTSIETVGHRLRSTPTNGHRLAAPSGGHPGTNRGRCCLTSVNEPLS